MKERVPEEKPKAPIYYTNTWEEAHALFHDLACGEAFSFETWFHNPENFSHTEKDALSGSGVYAPWENEERENIEAKIVIGFTPPFYAEDGPETLSDSINQEKELKDEKYILVLKE